MSGFHAKEAVDAATIKPLFKRRWQVCSHQVEAIAASLEMYLLKLNSALARSVWVVEVNVRGELVRCAPSDRNGCLSFCDLPKHLPPKTSQVLLQFQVRRT